MFSAREPGAGAESDCCGPRCADSLEARAVGLRRALPPLSMDEAMRASAMELCSVLSDTSGRVKFELDLLQEGTRRWKRRRRDGGFAPVRPRCDHDASSGRCGGARGQARVGQRSTT